VINSASKVLYGDIHCNFNITLLTRIFILRKCAKWHPELYYSLLPESVTLSALTNSRNELDLYHLVVDSNVFTCTSMLRTHCPFIFAVFSSVQANISWYWEIGETVSKWDQRLQTGGCGMYVRRHMMRFICSYIKQYSDQSAPTATRVRLQLHHRNPRTLRIWSFAHDCRRTLVRAQYGYPQDLQTPTVHEENPSQQLSIECASVYTQTTL
jgi:hypothetical protein